MKRTIILLLILAVATMFVATSCKSKSVFGGVDIPSQPKGVIFLDTGFGWEEVPWEHSFGGGFFINDDIVNSTQLVELGFMKATDLVQKPKWHLKGSRIRIGYRLTAEDQSMQAAVANGFSNIAIVSLYFRTSDGHLMCRPSEIKSIARTLNDKTDYAAGWVYKEFTIPSEITSHTSCYAVSVGPYSIYLDAKKP